MVDKRENLLGLHDLTCYLNYKLDDLFIQYLIKYKYKTDIVRQKFIENIIKQFSFLKGKYIALNATIYGKVKKIECLVYSSLDGRPVYTHLKFLCENKDLALNTIIYRLEKEHISSFYFSDSLENLELAIYLRG